MQLGDKVRVKAPIVRRRFGHKREWERIKNPRHFPAEGCLVGLRTLSNGTVDYYPEDGTRVYVYGESVRAALVATSLRHPPILAFIEDVEVIE